MDRGSSIVAISRRCCWEPRDIQSLADLGNSFAFVENMTLLPMGSRTPIHLAIACLIPMAPLLLIVMPLRDILEFLVKTVF